MPLYRILHVWALAVGIVVCGQYFGWNAGLDRGPAALGLASLFVFVFFLAWVFALAELSVALPTSGGPLDYGRRASGPLLGFVMAWSMFLECLFGLIATALATGGYVAFLVEFWIAKKPEPAVAASAALVCVVVFLALQVRGVREQTRVLTVMTVGALLALVLFWVIAAGGFCWGRLTAGPAFPKGPAIDSVLHAVPFALWWLIIIEGVVLAAALIRDPARTLPRGMSLAMLTIGVMIVLTITLSCGAMDWRLIHRDGGDYPLPVIAGHALAGSRPWLLGVFTITALLGLTASYHGLLFGSGMQLRALGEAGYMPGCLGTLHATRGTPVAALLACSLVTAGVVIVSLLVPRPAAVTETAILVAGLASLVWYGLAMGCLVVLRRRHPDLFRQYRAPLSSLLPWLVIAMTVVALYAFLKINAWVVPITLALYAAGLGYYFLWARSRLPKDPPEVPEAEPLPDEVSA